MRAHEVDCPYVKALKGATVETVSLNLCNCNWHQVWDTQKVISPPGSDGPFERELRQLIRKYSKESGSDTPG